MEKYWKVWEVLLHGHIKSTVDSVLSEKKRTTSSVAQFHLKYTSFY